MTAEQTEQLRTLLQRRLDLIADHDLRSSAPEEQLKALQNISNDPPILAPTAPFDTARALEPFHDPGELQQSAGIPWSARGLTCESFASIAADLTSPLGERLPFERSPLLRLALIQLSSRLPLLEQHLLHAAVVHLCHDQQIIPHPHLLSQARQMP